MRKVDLTQAAWRTSSRSSANGQCVEVAFVAEAVATRDSKNPSGGSMIVGADQWTQFMEKIQGGNG